MLNRLFKCGLFFMLAFSRLSANSAEIFSDDFVINPFGKPAGWKITYRQFDKGSRPVWRADTEDVQFVGNTSEMKTTSEFSLPIQRRGSFIQFEFKLTDLAGVYVGSYAMLKRDGSDGYKIGPYTLGTNKTIWSKDSRLTVVKGGKDMPALRKGIWYKLKISIFNDETGNKSVVSAYLYGERNNLIGFIVTQDSSSGRLKKHNGIAIRVYPGNNGHSSGLFIDNVVANGK